MIPSALLCLASGSEEMESITVMDILVRGGIKVTLASVADNGSREILCSRGARLSADVPLVQVADTSFDAIILPGGAEGARHFRDSPLLIAKIRQMQLEGKIVAAICASPAVVLQHHHLFPLANMTSYPTLKDQIPTKQWQNKRVVYDQRFNLVTSQGPATAIDFALKLVALLQGETQAATVADELVLPPCIYNYRPE